MDGLSIVAGKVKRDLKKLSIQDYNIFNSFTNMPYDQVKKVLSIQQEKCIPNKERMKKKYRNYILDIDLNIITAWKK